jgi:hypothetical protein
MQLCPTFYRFILLWSKHSPQRPVPKYLETMKSIIFWDITPYTLCLPPDFLLGLFFDAED